MARQRKRDRQNDLPRELERAGALCLAFANTGAPTRDARRNNPPVQPAALTYADLLAWARRMGILSPVDGEQLKRAAAERPRDAAAALAEAAELRDALLSLFTDLALRREPEAKDLATLNEAMLAWQVVPAADGFAREWRGDADTLDRMLPPLAHSAAKLLISEDRRKIRQCGISDCFRLFVYRDRRRIWCDPDTCGNRAKGRRLQGNLRDARKEWEREQRRQNDQWHAAAERRRAEAEAEGRSDSEASGQRS